MEILDDRIFYSSSAEPILHFYHCYKAKKECIVISFKLRYNSKKGITRTVPPMTICTQEGKRETGERPVRSRHCERGAKDYLSHWRKLGRRFFAAIRKSGNLPFRRIQDPNRSRPRGIGRIVLSPVGRSPGQTGLVPFGEQGLLFCVSPKKPSLSGQDRQRKLSLLFSWSTSGVLRTSI